MAQPPTAPAGTSMSVEAATTAIRQANLTPIEHKILTGFVEDANSPDLAAREVLKRLSAGQDAHLSAEETLRALKDDWHKLVGTVARPVPDPVHARHLRELVYRRDRRRCCLCRLPDKPPREGPVAPEPTLILPPSLALCLENDSLRLLLDAFLDPPDALRLRDMLLDSTDIGVLTNTWLLRPEASQSFRNGYFMTRPSRTASRGRSDHGQAKDESKAKYHVLRLYPESGGDFQMDDGSWFSQPVVHCSLETEDPKSLPLPSPFLFQTHSKLVRAFHNFRVEERILEGWPPRQASYFFGPRFQLVARTLWLSLIPKFVRNWVYRHLLALGRSRYPREVSFVAQQLPFGLYAKTIHPRSFNSEPNALRLLERHAPSVPVPRLIDTFETQGPNGTTTNWFIMTALPGVRAQSVVHRMSYAERDQLGDDLRAVLEQVARIPNTSPALFANVSGGPIVEPRLAGKPCGPYSTEADFNTQMGKPFAHYLLKEIPDAFDRTHRSILVHGDLVLLNVMVDGGRLSGVIDWEYANFMPEYWDCAKAIATVWGYADDVAVLRRVWGDRFDHELEVMKWLMRVCPAGGGSPT